VYRELGDSSSKRPPELAGKAEVQKTPLLKNSGPTGGQPFKMVLTLAMESYLLRKREKRSRFGLPKFMLRT
jgi:hypothetical protein